MALEVLITQNSKDKKNAAAQGDADDWDSDDSDVESSDSN